MEGISIEKKGIYLINYLRERRLQMITPTKEILDMMDEDYFPAIKFIYNPEFLSSKIFKRYLEKCTKLMTDFCCNCLTENPINNYSETTFRQIFLTSYFHLLRTEDTHQFIGEIALEGYYPSLIGANDYKELIASLYLTPEDFKEYADSMHKEIPESSIVATQNGINLMLDNELAGYLNHIAFAKYDYNIEDLVNHALATACKWWLERECMVKDLRECQINSQAIPETLVDRYQIYVKMLSIFHSNLMMHLFEAMQNHRVDAKLKNARKQHKAKVKELTSNNKLLQKELDALQTENQKYKHNTSQKVNSNNNDKLVMSLQDEVLTLQRKLAKAEKEIESLNSKNEFLETQIATNNEAIATTPTQLECDFTKKYAFVCQHETLSSKIKQAFPNSLIIDKANKNFFATNTIDAVVMLTSEISHPLYNFAKQHAVSADIPYVHCKEINIDRIADCIAMAKVV